MNVDYPEGALKPELLAIAKNEHHEKVYAIDKIIEAKGHTSLRLPPYHADLNPIELIWGQIKHDIATRNTTFKGKDLVSLVTSGINNITKEYWKKCVQHTTDVEDTYIRNDGVLPAVDNFIIQLAESDSSDSSSDESETE